MEAIQTTRKIIDLENNPSPSNDTWFDDPENMKMMELGSKQLREGQGKEVSLEDIKGMLSNGL
jgi:hypothetical protein